MEQLETENWVMKLSGGGADQDTALQELGSLLNRRLTRSFGSKPGVDRAFIEDAVQDALLRVLAALDQFQAKSKFTTWATTIAVRTALSEMRRSRWKDISLEQLMEAKKIQVADASSDNSTERQIAMSQLVNEMYRVINSDLTEKQRTALLAELDGMPMEEIGRHLGANRNAIYKLTHDARKRLKKGLLAAGYSDEDLAALQKETS